MSQVAGTDFWRASLAVFVGVLLCCVFIFVEFAGRYWGAVGIFSAEDWLRLTPDAWGKAIDYALGLAVGVGFWAVAHSQGRRGLYSALTVGGLSTLLAPQINAVFHVWRMFGRVDWGIAVDSFVRAVPMFGAGALVGATMWWVAYRTSKRA